MQTFAVFSSLLFIFLNLQSCGESKKTKNQIVDFASPNNQTPQINQPNQELRFEIETLLSFQANKEDSNLTRVRFLDSFSKQAPVVENTIPLSKTTIDTACADPVEAVSDSRHIYLACALSSNIFVFDNEDFELIKIWNLEPNLNLHDMVIIDSNRAALTAYDTQEILIIDLSLNANKRILKRFKTSYSEPDSLIYFDNRLYVTLQNLDDKFQPKGPGVLEIFETESFKPQLQVELRFENPSAIALDPSQKYIIVSGAGSWNKESGYGVEFISLQNQSKNQSYETLLRPGAITTYGESVYVGAIEEAGLIHFEISESDEIRKVSETSLKDIACVNGKKVHEFGLSMITDVMADELSVYLSEFNSFCLIQVDRKTKEVQKTYGTGQGPKVLFAWSAIALTDS